MAAGLGQHWRRIGHRAQPVQHAGMAEHAGAAQRQAKHGAQMVLELRGLAAFDGPVPGVVHARRHLVGQQFAIAAEQLQREHAHPAARRRTARPAPRWPTTRRRHASCR
ncbi:hypothetical protein G6F58_013193 [Rhizopus delemar]|nr:hypothetical protein G6F58_013193 [Rhizopus delemar]